MLLTKPFVWRGETLHINADARRGLMKVEVADPMGDAIDGYAVQEAPEIRDNGLRIEIGWRSNARPGALQGRTVRLRFYMSRARLYSFSLS